ncbi:MAG: hypothetical protein JXB47_14910 [Anaerolineae bacterium]|nr:hypothetical protein [Anaerolineae bacterium]
MRSTDVKHVLAEALNKELDDKSAALPPTSLEALRNAFNLVSDEIARREALARRAGDLAVAQRLMAGLQALLLAESSLDDDVLLNDFLFNVHDLREAFAAMPPWNPNEDDAWVQK